MQSVHKMEPIEGIHGPEHTENFDPSVFGDNRRTLMMWIFIASDALLFGAFLAAYGFIRFVTPSWPDQWKIFDPVYLGAMTVLLLSSSTLMAIAVEAYKNGKKQLFAAFYLLTIVCGFVFLGMQAHEWMHFIAEGARLGSNPWGVPIFSSLFFMITGFHGFHVLTGVTILCVVGLLNLAGKVKPSTVELAGMYWSFVDLVWVFIFTVLYLL